MRLKHQRADGFTVWASRTIAVPVEAAFDAFVDSRRAEELAHRWDDVAADLAAGPHGTLAWENASTRLADLTTFLES